MSMRLDSERAMSGDSSPSPTLPDRASTAIEAEQSGPTQPVCQVHQLGLVGYRQARQLQEQLAAEIADARRPPTLLLLEHPHTFTFGRRGKPENLLWSGAELEAQGVELLWSDRGGDITYHGPGQLVGYPLLPLGALNRRGRLPQADYLGYLRADFMLRRPASFCTLEGVTPS